MTKKTRVTDLNALIKRIRQRDQNAFREFYAQFGGKLYGLAYSYVMDSNLAEDLMQEVMCHFLRQLFKGLEIEFPLAYLAQSIRRAAMKSKEKLNRLWKQQDDDMDLASNEQSVLDQFIKTELNEMIWKRIEELPLKQKEVVVMHLNNEMSFESISHVLEMALGTVLRRYYSGIERIRKSLGVNDE